MKVEESRLSVLFEEIAEASDHGRYPEALRLADIARRFAPENPTVILIHARLLMENGHALTAATLLRGREDAQSQLVFADAARRAGLVDEAGETLRQLIARHAADCWPELAIGASRLCGSEAAQFPGWIGVDSKLRLMGALSSGSVATIEQAGVALGQISAAGEPQSLVAFCDEIKSDNSGPIDVRAGGRELLGSGLPWPPDFGFAGWVVLEGSRLNGEVSLDWNPSAAVTLVVGHGGTESRVTVAPGVHAGIGRPFSVKLGGLVERSPQIEVSALMPDGHTTPLAGSPIKLPQPHPVPIEAEWARQASFFYRPPITSPPMVNIVIPVHSGKKETLSCLWSVFGTLPKEQASLTVVDDASPEPQLSAALRKMANAGHITLLRNPTNLGFPGAANRGMRLFPDRDVILLNADTEVFDGWVERLAAAAYVDEHIGTVTPLGEAASIVSYPGDASRSASSAEAARIDRIAAVVNANRIIDLPVGVGFCLYMRRRCLDEVGDFDELGFGRGYGEENDFCLRARARGWRHVAAADVFVRHVGGRSFGPAKDVLQARSWRVMNYRHPGYDVLIKDFLAADPLREARRAIDRQRLIELAKSPILIVSVDLPGGVKRHVEERVASLVAAHHTVLVLRTMTGGDHQGRVVITVSGADLDHLVYGIPRDTDKLRALLVDLKLDEIELHHFLGLTTPVLEMLVALDVPYRIVVHDYAWICPRITLLNGEGVYCGEPAVAVCEVCVKTHGSSLSEPLTVAELRARSSAIFGKATAVVAPTQDVRKRLERYFPGISVQVQPWESGIQPSTGTRTHARRRDGVVRVAILGAINAKKGWSVLLECARDAAARQLPLEFTIIGYSSNDPPLLETGRVSMTGPYQEDEVAALLEREACDVALFPSVGPETWCYTLTYALTENLPIVALDLGAVAERLRDASVGELLPLNTPPADINDALLRVAGDRTTLAAPAGFSETIAMIPPNGHTVSVDNPTAPDAADDNRDASSAPELAATVEVLTLPEGIYAFTVQSGGSAPTTDLVLPALQVSPAPVRSAGVVEFLRGPTTMDRWLTGIGDVVTVRVTGGDAPLLLTSLRSPGGGVLSIHVQRLDAPAPAVAQPEASPLPPAPMPLEGPEARVVTLVHVPYLGDLSFIEGWAGRPSENLWIEGFSVAVEEPPVPDLLEYCGINEAGEVTEWLTGGEFCGNRGTGVPLVAFAVRVRPDADSTYSCQYSGRFLSGGIVGPLDDGSLCRSEAPGDPLVAIELKIEPVDAPNRLMGA